jgi:hypothetical protein
MEDDIRVCNLMQGGIFPQRVRTKAADLGCELRCGECKFASHRSGYIDHLKSLTLKPDLFKQIACVLHSASGVEITLQVMAVARQSTRNKDAICAVLERSQNVADVHSTCAEHLHNLD